MKKGCCIKSGMGPEIGSRKDNWVLNVETAPGVAIASGTINGTDMYSYHPDSIQNIDQSYDLAIRSHRGYLLRPITPPSYPWSPKTQLRPKIMSS